MIGLSDVIDYGVDSAGDGLRAVAHAGDAILDKGAEAIELAERSAEQMYHLAVEGISDAIELANQAFDTTLAACPEPWQQLDELCKDAWHDASAVLEASIDRITTSLERVLVAELEVAESVLNACSGTIELESKLLEALVLDPCSAAEEMIAAAHREAQLAMKMCDAMVEQIESAAALIASVAVLIGDLVLTVVNLLKRLGACLGSQVIYQLAKAHNVALNSLNIDRTYTPLSAEFRRALRSIFGDVDLGGVYYHEMCMLAPNWFDDFDVEGMTFGGVAIAGVMLNQVIFLQSSFKPHLVVHELVHVKQLKQIGSEKKFACAYGIGYVDAGSYEKNPFEQEAISFVNRHYDEIESWQIYD